MEIRASRHFFRIYLQSMDKCFKLLTNLFIFPFLFSFSFHCYLSLLFTIFIFFYDGLYYAIIKHTYYIKVPTVFLSMNTKFAKFIEYIVANIRVKHLKNKSFSFNAGIFNKRTILKSDDFTKCHWYIYNKLKVLVNKAEI